MFDLIEIIALDTSWSLYSTCESSIFSLSAILILENARVYVSTTDYGNVSTYIKVSVNKSLTKCTTLGILNVNPYNSYIRL